MINFAVRLSRSKPRSILQLAIKPKSPFHHHQQSPNQTRVFSKTTKHDITKEREHEGRGFRESKARPTEHACKSY